MLNIFKERAIHIVITSVFLAAIYVPFFSAITEKDHLTSQSEKRNLTSLPSIPDSIESLLEYPQSFNNYYADHFGFREYFTERYFRLMKTLNNTSTTGDVTRGKDGWLFLGSIKPGYRKFSDPMGHAMNVTLFTQEQLEQFAASVTALKRWLNAQEIEYIYVIAPNKHTIYFEQLPDYITKKNPHSATDQLVQYLREHTDVPVVDMRDSLIASKKTHQLYHKYDTHWNHYGANIAQFEIMKAVASLFPGKVEPFLLKNDQFKTVKKRGGDLARFANLKKAKENVPEPIWDDICDPITDTPEIALAEEEEQNDRRQAFSTQCENQELKALIFRDSFTTALQPYLSRYFSEATYVWEKVSYDTLKQYVDTKKPNIVIEEIIERTLPYIPSESILDNINRSEKS